METAFITFFLPYHEFPWIDLLMVLNLLIKMFEN